MNSKALRHREGLRSGRSAKARQSPLGSHRSSRQNPSLRVWLLMAGLCWWAMCARAAIQFDVFLGYDGIVPEAAWFPVVCEIKNDGPSFKGTIELGEGSLNQGRSQRLSLELPSGTLKRVVIPVFSSSRGYDSWDLRLLDEGGRVRAEQAGLRPRRRAARGTPIMGAISRTASGTPVIKPILAQSAELQPASARLLPSIFPDNPLVLEGLTSLYLNSERASELSASQVSAIFAWLNVGGHLIVGVEQPTDIRSSPWLRSLLPCQVNDLRPLAAHPQLQAWLTNATWSTNLIYSSDLQRQYGRPKPNVPATAGVSDPFGDLSVDADFEAAQLQVAVGKLQEGTVDVSAGDTPLMVTGHRGRGRVTVLLFSPEREPMRSWKNLPVFWAKLAEVPGAWYTSKEFNVQGGWSSDGIFGAMIDSRQVHKLPVGWLLLLLIVYLVVIGPLDQYWLKRIGRPMLTWITFPCYVVVFSLVIYFIGYKLRAGESEWNELHVVDVLANGESAELRGRTYASVYSPSNQRYALEGQQKYSTLRGEFAGQWGGGQSGERTSILQIGDSFRAEIFVPVWTSELYVNDWWEPAPSPLLVSVLPDAEGWRVKVDNQTDARLTNLQWVMGGRVVALGDLGARQGKTFPLSRESGILLRSFVNTQGLNFQNVVTYRQRALGAAERGQIADLPSASMAASFLSQLSYQQGYPNSFTCPPGLDLSPTAEQGGAVLLAWAEDFSPVKPIYRFTPRRSQKHTLWRVAVSVK